MLQFVPGFKNSPAMTNTERQRLFRKRHPGYYGRLKATQRAAAKRDFQIWLQKRREQLAAQAPAVPVPTPPVFEAPLGC
jgi:hypothetical protein